MCRGEIVRKSNKRDGNQFLGCSQWPSCKFTEAWDSDVAALCERMQNLESELAAVKVSIANRNNADISKSLRTIIAFAHPDKWPSEFHELSHGVVAQLNRLRGAL